MDIIDMNDIVKISIRFNKISNMIFLNELKSSDFRLLLLHLGKSSLIKIYMNYEYLKI